MDRVRAFILVWCITSVGLITYAVAAYTGWPEGEVGQDNLKRHEQLDAAYNKRDWETFRSLHDADVAVVFPDGRRARGLEAHMDEVRSMLWGSPDARITRREAVFGGGEWTAVAGQLEAAFTEPLPAPGGNVVEPTGRKAKVPFAALLRWRGGKVIEKRLFWDNASYLRQLGVVKESASKRSPNPA